MRRVWVALLASGLVVGCSDAGAPGPAMTDAVEEGGSIPGADASLDSTSDADTGTPTDHAKDDAKDGTVGEEALQCGAFGAPCTGSNDCCSGYCVETFNGFQCTDLCVDSCPDGFSCKVVLNSGSDVVTICVPNVSKLCHECTQDLQCNGGQCIKVGSGTFCTVDCSQEPCPVGFTCEEDDNKKKRCLPENGTCDCEEKSAGAVRPCAKQNEFGACNGVETCDPSVGWSTCSALQPKEEACDGLDNDCDGLADEDFKNAKPCKIENVKGSCEGIATCQGPLGWVCSASAPADETCDFLDNDCDGSVDEDFKIKNGKYGTVHDCGGCGKDCEGLFQNAVAKCDDAAVVPQCIVDTCEPGYYKANDFQCLPEIDTLCQPCVADWQCGGGFCAKIAGGSYCSKPCAGNEGCGSTYLCLSVAGADGEPKGLGCVPKTGACDCNPATEGQKRPCTAENALGTCFGFETCDGQVGWGPCDATEAALEECNGADDDCNGLVDDALPLTQPCENAWPGVGVCKGESSCFGAAGWVCNAAKPGVEICDYKDNDCDGLIDEDFKNADGKYSTDKNCGSCGNSCVGGIPNASATCNTGAATPICVVATCNPGYYQLNAYLCLPEGESFCKLCKTDVQCDGKQCLGIGDALFCSEACATSDECGDGFTCQPVQDPDGEVKTACVPTNGTCDCNSYTAGAKRPCEQANDLGTCVGFSVCDPAVGWGSCSAKPAVAESCNGFDDDCDGLVDDDLPASSVCEKKNAFGACPGTQVCAGGQGWLCSAKEPQAELCDFVDNDCDGQIDEDFKNAQGKYGSNKHCGTCNASCGGTIDHAKGETCDPAKSKPTCVATECEEGYFKLNDFQCIDQPDVTCFPCQDDAGCFGGLCVQLGEQKACVDPCQTDADCNEGFACDGESCLPLSGSCDCTEATKGVKKLCSKQNGSGTCVGFSTCDPSKGWSACDAPTPKTEECNGLDDDCNGIPDDSLPAKTACEHTNQYGKCTGDSTCQGSAGWVCQAKDPAAETCNFQDDDCDGQVDEDFKSLNGKYASAQNCGTCGKACGATVANSQNEQCDVGKLVPQCVATSCAPGYYLASEVQCITNPAISCSPCVADDTCFGGKCTTVGSLKFCLEKCPAGTCKSGYTCKAGLCQPENATCDCTAAVAGAKRTCSKAGDSGTSCLGFETCDPDVGWKDCSANTPATEVCNGKDDDCNGLIDDGLPLTQVCFKKNVYGQCSGLAQCYGSAGWVCLANEPAPETCDFKDNDCDLATDEDYKDAAGKYSTLIHCGTCNNACGDAYPHSASEACDASKTVPQCIVDSCDPGYLKLNEFQCIEIPKVDCAPCATDANCFGEKCMTVDTGLFCLLDCPDGTCESGYQCLGGMCRPNNGTCDCTAKTSGSKRTCSKTNAIGTCYGFETCDPAKGWGTCDAKPPAVEVCNGFDDDCNGFVDDGLPAKKPCVQTNQYGTCSGQAVCFGTVGWFCQAPLPAPEACDYKDNDCDSLTDEGFKDVNGKYSSYKNCGGCGDTCEGAILNATTVCDATMPSPQCVVESCGLGWEKYNEFLCVPITASLCEPCAVDENCVTAGAKCVPLKDGFACGTPCDIDTDCPTAYACIDPGVGVKQCVPATGSCDCDGTNLDLQKACKKEFTPPAGGPTVVCKGTDYCTATGWTGCTLPAEVCNAQDDNCNGVADETFKNAQGKYASEQHCGKCNRNCGTLAYTNGVGVCNTKLDVPDCVMKCNTGYFDTNGNPADGCECKFISSQDYPDGADQNCDGIDGEIANAIFVAKNGSDANPGTIDKPKLTIQAGIDTAFLGGKRDVYVNSSVYSENLVLAVGVSVYGGYSASFEERDIQLYETAVIGVAPTQGKLGAINAINIVGTGEATRFDGFTVFGFNNQKPGGSSYGIYVRSCDQRLRILNNKIIAGAGGNGDAGLKGEDGLPGLGGTAGVKAYDITTSVICAPGQKLSNGGAAGAQTCGGTSVSGGKGGDGYCPTYDTNQQNKAEGGDAGANAGGVGGGYGYDGIMSPAGGTAKQLCYPADCGAKSSVANCYCDSSCAVIGDCCADACQFCGQGCGASGGNGTPGPVCVIGNGCGSCIIPPSNLPMVGGDGLDGAKGVAGAGGSACGQASGGVSNGQWVAGTGAGGGDGTNGGGGGGGGAGNGVQTCTCTNYGGSDIGGTGGGGGSGACGGTSGQGGQGGGGSFGIFIFFDAQPTSVPTVQGNAIQRGMGGLGGPGGNGGVGGVAGLGAKGGASGTGTTATFCAGKGGNGGRGGDGGHAGGGGGGCGGASYAIFAAGQGGANLDAIKSGNTLLAGGAGGGGGPGGLSLGNSGSTGAGGAFDVTNF